MAERRAITGLDVQSNVEGCSEMSDEAFARRFSSDRAELLSLGVPLQSQRDEFTGEELYTLRSEQYFLPKLELEDEELAALQTAFYLLEGKFAYAEPLRLALQNLALGRPGFSEAPTEPASRVEVLGDTAWWVRRAYGGTGKLEDGVFVTEYSSIPQLASWVLRQNGRAVPLEPAELKRDVAGALRRVRERHEGQAPKPAREKPAAASSDGAVERPAGPVAPERFAVLQALLAYLLAACGEERDAEIPAPELLERFPSIPADELEEHLSLLNLVNFGGGCYTIYAELHEGSVHVDKELWGDTFRAAPRLTPLEARAIRLALEYVGPMIAADAHTPLSRVRKKLEETFGQFELARTPEPHVATEEVDLVSPLARAMHDRKLVEIEYQKEADSEPSTRLVEPYSFGRELPNSDVHTWRRTSDGERSFRLDRMRSAKVTRERFEAREGFEPTRLSDARTAKVLYDEAIARWAIERGARLLADGSAVRDLPVGSDEWLESEVLSLRGEAILLEPDELRQSIAARAKALAKELGVERMRARV